MSSAPKRISARIPAGMFTDLSPPSTSENDAVHFPNEKTPEVKIRGRHPDFTRWDTPFGLEMRTACVIVIGTFHLFAVYGVYLIIKGKASISAFIFGVITAYLTVVGVSVGSHRYWSHRSFKANKALRIILMIMHSAALQFTIFKWALDHRLHHKYTDTDKDPYNSKRGFFFSHVGWLFQKPHPEYVKAYETFDASDLENDPVVRFQCRWYFTLVMIFHFGIPVFLFHHFWNFPLFHCICYNSLRFVLTVHITMAINSIGHRYGSKPYDKNISPVDNTFIAAFTLGEGWHNYHHTFPWDYRASDHGGKIHTTTMYINFFAWLGWAWDLRTVSKKVLKKRLRKTGDGSHRYAGEQTTDSEDDDSHNLSFNTTANMGQGVDPPWGWGDDEIPEDLKVVTKRSCYSPNLFT